MIKAQKTTKWLGIIIIFTLLFAALGLTGCDSDEPIPAIEEGAAEVEVAVAEVQATEAAAEVDEVAVEEVMVEETAVTNEPIDECLACHIDKEMLIASADPIQEVISENEGEG